MTNSKYQILLNSDGKDEIVTTSKYANSKPLNFEKVDEIKRKGITRCFFVFRYNPEENPFLNSLNIVFHFHAGSVTTKVFEYKNSLIAIAPLGGPSAAKLMEELSIFGITEFIAIGSAGCLDPSVKDKFILVEKAVRDEGTSYHYLKPSIYVETNHDLNNYLEKFLKQKDIDYIRGTTWTTDAFYRETQQKIDMAKNYNAIAAEMECASWCAVAKYRGFKFAQLLYFSDVLNQKAWTRLINHQSGYNNDKRDLMILLTKDMIDSSI